MQRLQDLEALEAARYAVMKASYEVKLILAEIAHKRFDPSQPRVPAGNSDGGQWTSTGGSGEGRVQVVSRTPPRAPGGRRNTNGPPVRPITIAGRTEWVSPTVFHQYNSSYALAQSMTNLARRYDANWRPESSVVGNVAGQIAANNATTAQALRHIQRINPHAISSSGSTLSIVAPRGQPPGFIARDAAASIRTLRTQREFETMAANLLAGARPFQLPNYNGIGFQRRDGVIVGIRTSQTHGPTIDLMFPKGQQTPVQKFHLLQGAKHAVPLMMEIEQMTSRRIYPIVRNLRLVDFDTNQKINDENFLAFCEGSMGAYGIEEPTDFRINQNILDIHFGNDPISLELATRFFLGYIISRGYAPMNFANAVDPDLEYGPIKKYGLRPQEIIDNIIADCRSRNYEPFDLYEVMFGWEQDCGLFMEDDPEETKQV
jgi:hypothetical protein